MLDSNRKVLIAGDVTVLTLVTLAGFIRHGTISTAEGRILITLIPIGLSWFMIAPFIGVYDQQKMLSWRQLWRPVYAIILASPVAAWLRGWLLDAPVQVIFITVIAAFGSLGLLLWRGLFIIWKASLR